MREEQLRILCALLSNSEFTSNKDVEELIVISEEIMSEIDSKAVGITQNKTTE